jgi:hypothetical protein
MADMKIYPPEIGASHAKSVTEMAILCMGGF